MGCFIQISLHDEKLASDRRHMRNEAELLLCALLRHAKHMGLGGGWNLPVIARRFPAHTPPCMAPMMAPIGAACAI